MYSVEWEQRSEKGVHIDLDPAMGRILSYKHTFVTLIIVKKVSNMWISFSEKMETDKQAQRLEPLSLDHRGPAQVSVTFKAYVLL